MERYPRLQILVLESKKKRKVANHRLRPPNYLLLQTSRHWLKLPKRDEAELVEKLRCLIDLVAQLHDRADSRSDHLGGRLLKRRVSA